MVWLFQTLKETDCELVVDFLVIILDDRDRAGKGGLFQSEKKLFRPAVFEAVL